MLPRLISNSRPQGMLCHSLLCSWAACAPPHPASVLSLKGAISPSLLPCQAPGQKEKETDREGKRGLHGRLMEGSRDQEEGRKREEDQEQRGQGARECSRWWAALPASLAQGPPGSLPCSLSHPGQPPERSRGPAFPQVNQRVASRG